MKRNTSKAKLKIGILKLLKNKNIEEISITELCEIAGIHRATFYDNYHSINDLFMELFQDSYKKIEECIINEDHFLSYEGLINMINLFVNDAEINQLFTQDNMMVYYENYMVQHFIDRICPEDDYKERYYSLFVSIGTNSIILRWLRDSQPCSVEELAQIILDFAKNVG